MSFKNMTIGDLVWAKVKGYPLWPARMAIPGADVKDPRNINKYYVYLFGRNEFTWIEEKNLTAHSQNIFSKIVRKTAVLQEAIDTFVKFSKGEKQSSDEVKKDDEGKKLRTKTVKILKSVPKKKRQVLTAPTLRKSSRKRPRETDDSQIPEPPDNSVNPDVVESILAEIEKKEAETSTKKIGFIGLGNIGKAIVYNLLKCGHNVTVWNRSDYKCDAFVKLGAGKVHSPSELVQACDIIFCCISDAEAVEEVVFGKNGILEGLESAKKSGTIGKGYVEMTSLDAGTSSKISKAIIENEGTYLEAPMCGTSKNAEDGSLFILASGNRALFYDCSSCFKAISKSMLFIKEEFSSFDICNVLNMFCGTVHAAATETMTLLSRLNVPFSDIMQILKAGPFSGITEKCKVMNGDVSQLAILPLEHIQTHMMLGLMIADDKSQPMPVTSAAREICKRRRRPF